MRLYPFIIILLVCSMLPSRANLGETVAQILARYGKIAGLAEATGKDPFGRILFKAQGYELVLFILDSKEVGARVSKLDQSAFSDAEIQGIMSSEANESKWTSVASNDPSCLQWSRQDKATVLYDKDKHMLMLTSDAMAQALQATEKASLPATPK